MTKQWWNFIFHFWFSFSSSFRFAFSCLVFFFFLLLFFFVHSTLTASFRSLNKWMISKFTSKRRCHCKRFSSVWKNNCTLERNQFKITRKSFRLKILQCWITWSRPKSWRKSNIFPAEAQLYCNDETWMGQNGKEKRKSWFYNSQLMESLDIYILYLISYVYTYTRRACIGAEVLRELT